MKRKIETCPAVFEPVAVNGIEKDVKAWLEEMAARYKLKWLLAHADDGVVWGRVENKKIVTAEHLAPDTCPPLRKETLQQARLFAPHAELLLWREEEGHWTARLISDAKNGEKPCWEEAIDEAQILWGTCAEPLSEGFTLMKDGTQGLRHAVPLALRGKFENEKRPLRLQVRHYIAEDEVGFTRIVASRLLELFIDGGEAV